MENRVIKLTLAVYRVTEKFPEDEPLKNKIRELADSILILSIENNPLVSAQAQKQLVQKINLLRTLFLIASGQKWVKKDNFFVLDKEYAALIQEFITNARIKKEEEKETAHFKIPEINKNKRPVLKNNIPPHLRQEKIFDMIKQKQEINFSDLQRKFPQLSSRTIRRDIDALIKKGLIQRVRRGKGIVIYKILSS